MTEHFLSQKVRFFEDRVRSSVTEVLFPEIGYVGYVDFPGKTSDDLPEACGDYCVCAMAEAPDAVGWLRWGEWWQWHLMG